MAKTRKIKRRTCKSPKGRRIGGDDPTKFPAVLVMYDPDAPVSKAKGAAWLHHLRFYRSASDYKDIVPYMPPSPPKGSGIHHYITEIYELDTLPILKGFNSNNRSDFFIKKFRNNSRLSQIKPKVSEFTVES